MAVEHTPLRPSWDCAGCGKPWPCDPAREELAAEHRGTHLALFMTVDMVDAARDNPQIPPWELHQRFLAWTRALRTAG